MNDFFLNELSIEPLATDFTGAYQRIQKFIDTYKSRPENIFEKRICCNGYLGNIQLAPNLQLQGFCKIPSGRTLGSLLLGLTKHPYIKPSTPQEDRYLESNYFIQKNDQEVPVEGLAAAFLHESIGISFMSESFWRKVSFSLIIVDANNSRRISTVLSVSDPSHFESSEFIQWKEAHAVIELIQSALPPERKQINLRDDHGKDVLLAFSRRIIRSPYVTEVINSLPYHSRSHKFISKIKADGIIELVLTGTDEGLGLAVKTTGRNLRETERIASILSEEFS